MSATDTPSLYFGTGILYWQCESLHILPLSNATGTVRTQFSLPARHRGGSLIVSAYAACVVLHTPPCLHFNLVSQFILDAGDSLVVDLMNK